MALRNAFGELALESTANTVLVDQITKQRELLEELLKEQKITNLYLSLMIGEELHYSDLDLENK